MLTSAQRKHAAKIQLNIIESIGPRISAFRSPTSSTIGISSPLTYVLPRAVPAPWFAGRPHAQENTCARLVYRGNRARSRADQRGPDERMRALCAPWGQSLSISGDCGQGIHRQIRAELEARSKFSLARLSLSSSTGASNPHQQSTQGQVTTVSTGAQNTRSSGNLPTTTSPQGRASKDNTAVPNKPRLGLSAYRSSLEVGQ